MSRPRPITRVGSGLLAGGQWRRPGRPPSPTAPTRFTGRSADAGSVTVLTMGYLAILLVLAFVVAEASMVYLARRSLAAECDGAAVAAAQSVDAARTYGRADPGATLALAGVQAAVARYPRRPDSSLAAALDGRDTVVVTGRRAVDLPLLRNLGVGSVTVSASARARTHMLGGAG